MTRPLFGTREVYDALADALNEDPKWLAKANVLNYTMTHVYTEPLNKTFTFRGGQNRIKATIDGFNILNQNTILGYSSNNLSALGSTQNPIIPAERISSILPPRVFRAGLTIWF